jgi:hypothetical protein
MALDFVLGAIVHFHVEHVGESLLSPGVQAPLSSQGLPPLWTDGFFSNLLAKYYFGLTFVGDTAPPPWLVTALLAALLLLVLPRLARGGADPPGPPVPASATTPP